jgi:hypothetical protein
MIAARNCSERELMMGFSIDNMTFGPPTSVENTQTPSFDPTHLTAWFIEMHLTSHGKGKVSICRFLREFD